MRMPLTRAFSAFFNTVADALFPVHPAEREALAMDESGLFKLLPRAIDAPIPEACSVFHYKDERVFHLVWSIKYKKSLKGASLAAHALFRILRSFESVIPKDMRILIIPMPITKARRRERGFNQCELIADAIARLDSDKHFLFAHDLLIRVRHTSRQTLKDRRERLKSIQDTFAVNPRSDLNRSDLFVVVIDDVITTGSTMRDAVGTLRRSGFKNTYGLSLAH